MTAKQRDLLALGFGCIVLFGLRLGARDLWNPNEPIYGEAVREMVERGDWLIPRVNDLVFAEKPILFYWLALAAASVLGGVSELTLRLPSLVAATATVLGAYVLTLPYAGRARALTSAVLTATLFGVFWNARFVQMDILVTAATVWVVIAVTRVVDHRGSALPGFALAGAVAGLGFAAKGPVAWLCPGLTLGAYLLATRRWREVIRWEAAAGAAVCLVVAAPWYLLLAATGHSEMIAEALFRQNLSRFVNPWDHRAPVWYYLETLWVDMAPWAFFLPLAVKLPRREDGERRLALLSWLWIVVIVAFFSLSRSKRSPYILPIAPAVAILAGEVLCRFVFGTLPAARRKWLLAIAGTLAALFLVAGSAVALAGPARLPMSRSAVVLFGAVLVLAGGLVAFDLLRERTRVRVPFSLASGTAAVYLMAAGVTLPALDAIKSARPACEEAAKLLQPGDEVISYAFWNWRAEYRYYLGRPITNVFGAGRLRELWTGPRRVVLFVSGEQLEEARSVIGTVAPAVERQVGGTSIYVFTSRPPGG